MSISPPQSQPFTQPGICNTSHNPTVSLLVFDDLRPLSIFHNQYCKDLSTQQQLQHTYRGKIQGKTFQVFPDGRYYENVKTKNPQRGSYTKCKQAIDSSGHIVARLVTKEEEFSYNSILHAQEILKKLQGVPGIVSLPMHTIKTENKHGENRIVQYQEQYTQDLHDFLYNVPDTFMDPTGPWGSILPDFLYIIAEQLLGTIKEMHQLKIYHRDLKPENILLKYEEEMPDEIKIALTDFEFAWSAQTNKSSPLHLRCGTPLFFSPERARAIKNKDKNFSEEDLAKNDMWAVGLILYLLFNGNRYPQAIQNILTGDPKSFRQTTHAIANLPEQIFIETRPIDELISQLLTFNPNKRLTAQEAYDRYIDIVRSEEEIRHNTLVFEHKITNECP